MTYPEQYQEYNWKAEVHRLPEKYKDCGFNNFLPRNEWEKKLKKKLIEFSKNKDEKRSLVLVGNIGTGKTHLAVAVMKNLLPVKRKQLICRGSYMGRTTEKYAEVPARASSTFLVINELFTELNSCFGTGETKDEKIRRYLKENDIVCLDELKLENFSAAKEENLYQFINRAYLDNKRIIITSNLTLKQIEQEAPQVVSRLVEMCGDMLIKFEGEDYRKEKQKQAGNK